MQSKFSDLVDNLSEMQRMQGNIYLVNKRINRKFEKNVSILQW